MRARHRGLIAATLAVAVSLAAPATAQDFPAKPIRYVVPYSPGTGQDIIARVLAPEMSKTLGQPFIIENRTGANTLIGYEYVAKQVPADGYTVAAVLVTDLATLPVTAKELRFDPVKDLPPVIGLAEGRFVIGSAAELPWKTFNELVAAIKAQPAKLNYGSASMIGRLSMEAVLRDAGLNVVYVPYSSGAAYLKALSTGEVQMGFIAAVAAKTLGEKYRVLAVTGEQRAADAPGVPTFAELGFPQVRGLSHSMNAPAGIPKVAFDRLYAAASKALKEPEVRTRLTNLQLDIVEQTPDVAAKRLAEEARNLADVARKANIQPQ
jgi:tripartite-type tricarboxylate transporter receptor subunit TctC